MIPGDFQPPRPSRKELLKFTVLAGSGFIGLAATVVFLVWLIPAWLGRPVVFGWDEGPDQPIAFPHPVHVQDIGLDCTFCHRTVTEERAASIPAVALCMTCHKSVGDGLPEVEKLRAIADEGRAINWVRVHRVPDHVRFVHEAHIRFFSERDGVPASAVCSTCHGDVASMTKVEQVRPLKMGDCVNCHRDNDAPTDCTTCHN